MNGKKFRNEDPALLEVEHYCAENAKMPLLKDVIVFGPKIEFGKEPTSVNEISTKIHVCNLFFSIVMIILGLLTMAFTTLGIVKMGWIARYYISAYVFAILIGILLIVSGLGSIRMKLNNLYSKYFVIFIIAIESGCFLVFLLVASSGLQQLVTYAPYSFYRKITFGIFTFSIVALLSLVGHLMALMKYIK